MMFNKTTTGAWRYGYICDNYVIPKGWPSVLCKQLGYEKAVMIRKGRPAGFNGQEYAYKCPACGPATADTMQECGRDRIQNCNLNQVVYVKCQAIPPPEVKVKLVGGSTSNEGYAMAYDTKYRRWGTICDKVVYAPGWPSVLCKQLGLKRAIKIARRKADVDLPYALICPACSPKNTETMAECGKDIGHTCNHQDDIYITCEKDKEVQNDGTAVNTDDKVEVDDDVIDVTDRSEGSHASPIIDESESDESESDESKKDEIKTKKPMKMVKLVGGKIRSEGFAMVRDSETKRWGTVCDIHVVKEGWPSVLCKEMGYDKAEKIEKRKSKEGVAKISCQKIAFKCPKCSPANAATMATCGKDNPQVCDHDDDVYVTCAVKNTCSSVGGQCIKGSSCGKGMKNAKSQGKDGKCPRDAEGNRYKCCVQVEGKKETCSAIGGECVKSSSCGEGFKSAYSQGKDGKCLKDAQGNKQKCCVKVEKEIKGTPCAEVGGECMTKTDGKCPQGFRSQKSGVCPEKGKKCCVGK